MDTSDQEAFFGLLERMVARMAAEAEAVANGAPDAG
jgi:hypothetical protein